MENELKSTYFDEQLRIRELEILKTTIPYLQSAQQRNIAIITKLIELQKTIEFYQQSNSLSICSMDNPEENMLQMLNEIRPYCNDKESENLDSLINMFQIFSAYDVLFK